MAKPLLYDAQGREIVPEKAIRPFQQAQTVAERDNWHESIATGITPQRLAMVLRNNDCGDNRELQTLAIEMQERNLHYFSLLQTRRNKVSGSPRSVVPGDDSAAAAAAAEQFENLVMKTPEFQWLIDDLMDAVDKGYSVNLPYWDTTTTPWTFKSFQHLDCRLFQFDKEYQRELRLRQEGNDEGKALVPGQLIIHFPRIRTGIPLRAGIARLCAVNWFLKTSTVKDWKAFAEVFGMPLRIGYYDPGNMSTDEKAALRTALMNLGHDAAAMLPHGMKIEFPDARRPTSGDNIYAGLAEYFDAQDSKAILGQTMTSDDGSSMAQAKVHDGVRLDIARADALAVGATLTKLAQLWFYYNFPGVRPCTVTIDVNPPEDRKVFTESVMPWVEKCGLEVPLRWLRGRLQIPEPEPGEEMVSKPEEPAPEGPGAPGAKPAKKPATKAAKNLAELKTIDQTDAIIADVLADWEAFLEPHRSAVETAANASEGYETFLAAIEGLPKVINSDPLVEAIAVSGMEARGTGAQ